MKGCSTCKYYNNTCGRYIMNPNLDRQECGKPETGYPHWELKITHEIKSKIFAQYLGQKLNEGYVCTTATLWHIVAHSYDNRELKLILKPLSSITDEDAETAYYIAYPKAKGNKFLDGGYLKMQWHNVIKNNSFAYQFLQSKGYDLPNYLLGGKTLFECSLAIYEHEKELQSKSS